MVTHVDDLLCSVPAVNLELVRAELSKKYESKLVRRSSFLIGPLAGTSMGSIRMNTPSTGPYLEDGGLELRDGVFTAVAGAEQCEESKVAHATRKW